MPNVCHVQHPLIEHHLAELRSAATSPAEFRRLIKRLSVLLVYRATQDLLVRSEDVTTPLATMSARILEQRIGLIPILRAGLGMVDAVLDLIPTAEVWHLGVYRDETTLRPVEYYQRLPGREPVDVALVLDPMLATGGSAVAALHTLQEWGVGTIKLLSVIAAQPGIAEVTYKCPDVQIFVAAIDEQLNAQGFIVPGLGDAGDRTFNTLRH